MSRQFKGVVCKFSILQIYAFFFCMLCVVSPGAAEQGDELLTLVQSEALEARVLALQENVTSFPHQFAYRTRSAHHREATDNIVRYIANQFRRSQRLQVREQIVSGIRNVVAVLPPKPTSASKRIFIVSAHYDTQAVREPNWNPLASSAPGANNNGTGVAAMLEIAQLLSQYEYEHELRFIALGGEELGFFGSRYYVQEAISGGTTETDRDQEIEATDRKENIVAVFNLDMLGFNWKSNLVEVVTNKESAWISRALIIANTWYDIGLKIRRTQDEFVDISSHKPFWDAGYAAVTLIESSTPWRDSQNYDANPFYHTFRDTADKINFGLVRKVTQLVLVTVDGLLTHMFQTERQIPQVTFQVPLIVTKSPVQIKGTFRSDFPIDIIVHPSKVTAELDRTTRIYTATVPLSPGENVLLVTAQYPFGATSVMQSVILEQAFAWKDVVVFPNPTRADSVTEFRIEANVEMTDMEVQVYDPGGNLIKRIEGIPDRLDSRVWRTWWNQQTSYGLAVSPGVYVCHISVVSKGETYNYLQKLAILR